MQHKVEVEAPTIERTKTRVPFAARVQGILVLILFVSLVMISQQVTKSLYRVGLPLLMLTAFLQIAAGSIPPTAGFRRSMTLVALTAVIIGVLFYGSILAAPYLIGLTR